MGAKSKATFDVIDKLGNDVPDVIDVELDGPCTSIPDGELIGKEFWEVVVKADNGIYYQVGGNRF